MDGAFQLSGEGKTLAAAASNLAPNATVDNG